MKKLLFILLSVVLAGSVGNDSNKDLNTKITDTDSTEVVKVTEKPITEVVTVETEEAEIVVPDSTEAVKETISSDEKTDTGKEKSSEQKTLKDETADNKQMDENKSSENQKKEEQPEDTKSEPASEKETKPEETAKPKEEPEKTQKPKKKKEQKKEKAKPKTVSYSPDNVVSLAISKCQAGGMVTTEQNLLDNLNAGNITQEEYEEYYPLDGLEDSYYSVFVNVDLNKAATTSGRLLGSEEAIAQHIADMLLLESGTVFNIRYTGTTKTSGETFYEFRCYR